MQQSQAPTEPALVTDLQTLNRLLDSCTSCTTIARGHRHVPGAGCTDQPDLMFVFINPTVRNFTAQQEWPGAPVPFAGNPKLWQILAEAGWVRKELPVEMVALGRTQTMVAGLVEEARRQRIYLTNAVKCVDDGSKLPAAERVTAAWHWLETEIALVRPRQIVALGLIPFRALTGQDVRLVDELWAAQHEEVRSYASRPIAGTIYPVFPCYFPTGRGNPVAATRMLAALHKHLSRMRE